MATGSEISRAGRLLDASRLLTLLLSVFPLAIGACSDDSTGPEERSDDSVDLVALFAPPSDAEIQAILAEWSARNPRAQGIEEEATLTISLAGTPGTMRVVSHLVDGVRHVGGVVAPDGAAPGSLPILVYAHGGDGGTSETELRGVLLAMGDLADDVVLVAPSFRDEPFRFLDQELVSEGPPSPWDRDVDDALALVEVALDMVPAADESRMGILGFSRGAGVGMLMGIRDARFDRIVGFFGPTDLFSPWIEDVVDEALAGQPRDLPGLDFLNEEFIQPLSEGALTVQDVRPEMVRRSAVLFADRLPPLQIHHGTADTIVPVEQAESLSAVMEGLGRSTPDFEAFIYQGGEHDPFSLPGSLERATEFLTELLGGG